MFSGKEKRSERSNFSISDCMHENLVIRLEENERQNVIKRMVDLLDEKNMLLDKESFLQAVIQREKIVSTAIGMGVALPHAKLSGYKKFFIAIGIHPQGVFWDALDSMNVRIVFMIGGPDDQQKQYLQLLSKLTLAIKDEERRKKILQLGSAKEIINLFENI